MGSMSRVIVVECKRPGYLLWLFHCTKAKGGRTEGKNYRDIVTGGLISYE